MIATIEHPLGNLQIDLSQPIDLAVPMHRKGPRAWYADAMWIRPVINRYFTGSVALGGKVNFNDIYFNPHAHGTHTETVGHITRDLVSIENALLKYWWLAKLISITPELLEVDSERMKKGDRVIMLKQLKQAIGDERPEALLIRTLPNELGKKEANYSNTNFVYMQPEAARWLAEIGVKHLLVDMPSVDREEDNGELLAHHAFWNYPTNTRLDATITEMIYADSSISDGVYVLELQVASFRNDAAPSRPLLYRLLNRS
jgi:arylformamidase